MMSEISLTHNQQARFLRAVSALNRLLDEVKQDCPEANYYLQENVLILLSGPSHDERERAHPEREISSATLYFSSGGGW